jgi:hypothetical protein
VPPKMLKNFVVKKPLHAKLPTTFAPLAKRRFLASLLYFLIPTALVEKTKVFLFCK